MLIKQIRRLVSLSKILCPILTLAFEKTSVKYEESFSYEALKNVDSGDVVGEFLISSVDFIVVLQHCIAFL
jgi:hypothetical protein